MKKLLFALSLLLPLCAAAQRPYLANEVEKDSLRVNMLKYAETSERISTSKKNYYLQSSALAEIFVSRIKTLNLTEAQLKTMNYVKSLYDAIGKIPHAATFSTNADGMPRFLKYSDGSEILLLDEFYDSYFLNDNKTSVRERASTIIAHSVNQFYLAMATTVTDDFPYIGLIVSWSALSQGLAANPMEINRVWTGECLLTIAPIQAIRDFYDLKISEDEFCKQCDYYFVDREAICLRRLDIKVFDAHDGTLF